MDETADEAMPTVSSSSEMNELLSMFDLPAFARRGQDLEYGLKRIDLRCQRERHAMLEMVRVRLRQWAGAVTSDRSSDLIFNDPLAPLWPLCGAEPPVWGTTPASARKQRAIANDLIASTSRFNQRWSRFLNELDFGHINRMIEQYNRYYLLEKECILGSARLAARFYTPFVPLSRDSLLESHPLLPVLTLRTT